ncbi:hypothetical protein ABT189_18030 [Streptomyces sp900105755]|uniref:hypothetical protein n=1 Tax=Streptomyces sp. 900105755 TaxID=3154389 RepID=UPI003321737D
MLHLRLITPAGDVVMCDVAREAGDELIHGLRALDLDRTGSIAVGDIGLLGIVRAGALTLLAQKWFWASRRERTAKAGGS